MVQTLNIYDDFALSHTQWGERLALEDGDIKLTYTELKAKVDALADILRSYNLPSGTHVGVYMPRSSSYVIAIMALFAARLSYAVLETASSGKFLVDSVEKYGVPLVISHADGLQFPSAKTPAIVLDAEAAVVSAPPTSFEKPTSQFLSDRAFVVFSSGTTGDPKAIEGTQQAMLGSYKQRQEEYGYFDKSISGWRVAAGVFFVWECIRPLLFGGTTVVIPDSTLIDPWALRNFLEERKVNEVLMTASYLELFLSINNTSASNLYDSGLRRVWLNGEVVTAALGRSGRAILGPNVQILNLYSISECHDVAVLNVGDFIATHSEAQGPVPVGKPLRQVGVWADENTEEILVSGPFLSTSYLGNHPANSRFVNSPARGRYYRTGDKGHLESDGTVIIHGRLHNSVRVRGRTVVLEEVESLIRDTLNIPQCGVIFDSEGQTLCAYIVRPEDAQASWTIDNSTGQSPEIRSKLLANAPADALVPGMYFEVQELPLDVVSNKVNRKALLVDWQTRKETMTSSTKPEANKDLSLEEALTKAWTSCLGNAPLLNEAGDADFFEQGGDSLNAPRLVQEISTLTGKKVSVMDVHQHRSFKNLIALLESAKPDSEKKSSLVERMRTDTNVPVRVPQQPAAGLGEKPKVILLTGATGFLGTHVLEGLSRELPEAQVVCLVRAADPEAGKARIIATREKFAFPGDLPQNVRVEVGSLDKPRLGLSLEVYQDLCQCVDTVVHTAALVNFGCDYDTSRGPNVVGAHNIALFVQESSVPKALHFVSSNGVYPMGGATARHCEEDTDILGWEDELENGYDQTKWVAERVFQKVQSFGYPISIYRPGNIGGNSNTGALGDQDFQGLIWRACIEVGAFPDLPKERLWMFESTPVDTIANFIVARASHKTRVPGMFNLICQPTIPANTILPGIAPEQVSLEEWFNRLKQHPDTLISSLPSIIDEFERYLLDENTYTVKAFHDGAKELGITLPAWDADYAKLQGEFLVKGAQN